MLDASLESRVSFRAAIGFWSPRGFRGPEPRVSFPYVEVFLGLLGVYMAYSVWARLDARYPIVAALVLLVATAVVDALGNTTTANTLAEYVFFLLGAGVVLLLIDQIRTSRSPRAPLSPSVRSTAGQPAQPAEPGKGTTDDSLDRFEKEPVPVVHAAGRKDQEDEEKRDE